MFTNKAIGKNAYNKNIYIETFDSEPVAKGKCQIDKCIEKIKNISAEQISTLKPENKRIIMQLLH